MIDDDSTQYASLADTPESKRYQHLLDGGSASGARLAQGATATKKNAAKVLGKLRDSGSKARQVRKDRKAIESGDVTDLNS